MPLKNLITTDDMIIECTGRKLLDIIIISEVSRSNAPEKMKQFQQLLLTSINISRDSNAVALMEFSETPRVLLTFDSPSSVRKADVLSMINQQQYENGPSTELADALDVAVTDVFSAQKGDRADTDNIVIVFTDGLIYKSEKKDVSDVIRELSAKAEVFVVASKEVNSAFREIASEPKDAHIFHLDGQVTKIKEKTMECSMMSSIKWRNEKIMN
ncbi:cuticlin-6-like [Haliotis rubra]|uniref:cuticlin-6-like n=1 Tax=Haliotis rubra TaxID=36100 RepID=UPI001EE50519|nr:cuticlin-6-like [Haliotis rubra]